jgi:hypothetical protein
MSRWQLKQVPPICERLIGFSIPDNGEFLVISYEGTHVLRLGTSVTVETDEEFAEYDLYDPDSGQACYRGLDYRLIGLHGGTPLLDGLDGERLNLDSATKRLSVFKNGDVVFSVDHENFSGDWAAATFSTDSMFIVLGCPYDFDFRIYERVD